MINLELIIVKEFGKFIPTNVDKTDILVFVSLVIVFAYGIHKLLSNSKYKDLPIVKLIDKIF